MLHTQEGFDQVVLQGVRAERGMAGFADNLQAADTAAVRAYLIARATEELKAQTPAPPPAPPPTKAADIQDD